MNPVLFLEFVENWNYVTGGRQEVSEVHLVYQSYQPELYGRLAHACNENITYHSEWPNDNFAFLNNNISEDEQHARILIIDDLGLEARRPERMAELYSLVTVKANHTRTFVIIILHDLYYEKGFRPVLKNASSVLITKCHLDFVNLGKLFFSGQPGFLRNAAYEAFYNLGCRYIIIANDGDTKPEDRLKAGLLPSESVGLFFRSI